MGTPMVMMFGWSNPVRIMPYGRPECVVAGEPDGRGAEIKSTAPQHSVSVITVERVFETVCRQISKKGS
jgi:hypothetical protein